MMAQPSPVPGIEPTCKEVRKSNGEYRETYVLNSIVDRPSNEAMARVGSIYTALLNTYHNLSTRRSQIKGNLTAKDNIYQDRNNVQS